ncbi:MAG TPA: hypothetical protein VG273_02150 [Bryobacteraceae bacterium]|nr:hypothetical protein [Bryobacteraceae bacterium]
MHRAWSARTKAGWGLAWLLAILVLLATVDRLPDPPAASPDCTQLKISATHGQLLGPAAPGASPVSLHHPPGEYRAIIAAVPVGHQSRILIAGRATDSSPPNPRLRRFQFKTA